MIKVGRNDPCPCGSGKKYKRCCLEKDQQNKVTRIAPESTGVDGWLFAPDPEEIDYETLVVLIEEELEWANASYQLIARRILDNMVQQYDPEAIVTGIFLWNGYSTEYNPIIRKVDVYPAAVEYTIAQLAGRIDVTQGKLAQKYDLSVGTISQRANQLWEFTLKQAAENDQEDSKDSLQSTPFHSLDMEREMHKIQQLVAGKEFASIDELNAFVNEQLNQPDTYNILAESTGNPEEMLAYYKQGMLAGERELGQAFFKENKGYFWGMIETRPYMRSKLGYVDALLYLGYSKEAIRQCKQLLELNPNDNQGVRYLLLTTYIEEKKYSEALKLLNAYNEDHTTHFNYNRILIAYGKNGISSRLTSLLQEAVQQNPHVADYILGKKKIPGEVPEYIGFGDKAEAIAYVQQHVNLWREEPELMRWFKQQIKTIVKTQ